MRLEGRKTISRLSRKKHEKRRLWPKGLSHSDRRGPGPVCISRGHCFCAWDCYFQGILRIQESPRGKKLVPSCRLDVS